MFVKLMKHLNDLEEMHEKNELITQPQHKMGKKFIGRDPLTSVSFRSLKWLPSSSRGKGGKKDFSKVLLDISSWLLIDLALFLE